MTNAAFHELFGGPPREPESQLTQQEMDLAASVQVVTEEIMLRMARHVHTRDRASTNLCLAGGVALNCVGNGRLLREGPFETSGSSRRPAMRAARSASRCSIWHQLLEQPRAVVASGDAMKGSYLGPAFADDEIERSWIGDRRRLRATRRDGAAVERVAELLADGEGRRLVPGPDGVRPARARRRSILGDPRSPRDAVDDEPQDQVPRVRSARSRRRCCASASPTTSSSTRDSALHAAGRAGEARSGGSR